MKDMGNQQGEIMIEYKKEELIELYNGLGSIKEVAKFLKVPYSTLHYHFKENKIGNYKNRGIEISKEELIKLHNKHGSVTKVAAALFRNYATVRAWYSYYDIIVNKSNMNVFQEIRNTPMSQMHKSVVLGSLLGDGHLRLAAHSKNALLEISHCEKQLEYLKWKKDILNPFSRPISLKEKANPQKKVCGNFVNASNFYRFTTVTHNTITEIYNKYYRNGIKGVHPDLIEELDLVALSLWFGDDGCICRDKYNEPKMCSIATLSFSYKEHLILIEALQKFFKGTIKINTQIKYLNGEKREYFYICMFRKNEVNNFLNTIKLVLPECIHYKLS